MAKKAINLDIDPIEGDPDLRDNGHQSVDLALSQTNARIGTNKGTVQEMLAKHSQPMPNRYYISRINTLIDDGKRLGKEVIFFYPNNLTQVEYKVLSQVAPFLPDKNLIRLPEGPLLNALFKPENLFDPHHLNRKGASIYTQFLQEESVKRVARL